MEPCERCPVHQTEGLVRLGVQMAGWDSVVALAGNPNTGKSTVFNRLTGLHQHTGNWPGKTVTRAEGGFSYSDRRYKIVDLPGTYSLLSTSQDEEVARNFILFGQPDVTVVVADATRLERNLNLVLQVLEITPRVVVCVNLIDEARRHAIDVDDRALARELGVPVVLTAARQGEGMAELIQALHDVAMGHRVGHPHHVQYDSPTLERALGKLVTQLNVAYPGLPNLRWIALRLLEGDRSIAEAVCAGELDKLSQSYLGSESEAQTR